MNKYIIGKVIAVILVPIINLAMLSMGHSATVISDTFSLDGSSRIVGASLSGLTTETGGLSWVSSANWVFAGDSSNGYLKSNANTNSILRLAFNPNNYTSYGTNITISADIGYIKSNGSYFDIVFAKNTSTPTTNGLIYLQVNPYAGTWQLMTNTTVLTSGSLSTAISSYSASTFYNYSISYDTSAHLVDISINGTQILDDYSYTISGTINNLFIWNQFPGTTSMVDNFSVAVVPEVSSVHLLLIGLVGLGIAGRKVRSLRTT